MNSARHVIKRILNPRCLGYTTSYDVASTIHQSLGGDLTTSPDTGVTIGNGQAAGVAALKIGYFGDGDVNSKAVQVKPMNLMLKAPGTKRLKLKYDEPLSSLTPHCNK